MLQKQKDSLDLIMKGNRSNLWRGPYLAEDDCVYVEFNTNQERVVFKIDEDGNIEEMH